MEINDRNYHLANKAMASVLLLYYHLLQEGGFTNDQTVYIDGDDFDGFSFIDSKLVENDFSLDIDVELINEGAVIFLLSELNDLIAEYNEDFIQQKLCQRIIDKLENRKLDYVPEANEILDLVKTTGTELDYLTYSALLKTIYKNYVVAKFKSFVA